MHSLFEVPDPILSPILSGNSSWAFKSVFFQAFVLGLGFDDELLKSPTFGGCL
jgi:hypothetical protein